VPAARHFRRDTTIPGFGNGGTGNHAARQPTSTRWSSADAAGEDSARRRAEHRAGTWLRVFAVEDAITKAWSSERAS
jgi:hypothetical protein